MFHAIKLYKIAYYNSVQDLYIYVHLEIYISVIKGYKIY